MTMAAPAPVKKKKSFGFTVSQPAYGILLQSKTVVEKQDYVSTGVLTYAEGDIIEVEMADFKVFPLGEKVKVTIYSPGGIYVFESNVVAKHQGSLMILNPPENQKKFAEKREHPRVQINESGFILSITDVRNNETKQLESPIELVVNNISVSGIGFTIQQMLELPKATKLEIEVNLGFPLQCTAEIIRREKTEAGVYYGAQFPDLKGEKLNSLRAYVLKTQVESYFVRKESRQEAEG
jgi:c-di-GMP-binding flagellar brake protein YcgR